MGHTIEEWRAKVSDLVRDPAGRDLSASAIDESGLRPAISQFSDDRPRRRVAEVDGDGSAYLDLPDEWVTDFSVLEAIEYPATLNPPVYLTNVAWRFIESVADPDVSQILLLDVAPTASEKVRLAFSTPWPFPDDDSTTDKISDLAFEAVSALAASYCCESLAAEAARQRDGAFPTDLVDGRDRAPALLTSAERYRRTYDRFVGRATAGGAPNYQVGTIRLVAP